MEGKKCTKISVSTFLLIITIIALGVMGFFLYKINDEKVKATNKVDELNNQVTDLTKTVDDLKNSINNNINNNQVYNNTQENSSNKTSADDEKGISFIQFDTKFYKRDECIIQELNVSKEDKEKTIEYDLNNDGKKEKIVFKINIPENPDKFGNYLSRYTAEYNGIEFYDSEEMSRLSLIDLDENDNSVEIVVFNAGPSDDPNVYIYKLVDGEIKLLKHLGDIAYIDKKGKMLETDWHNPSFTPLVFKEYFELKNNEISERKLDLSKYKDTTFTASNGMFVEDLNNIVNYNDIRRLKENESFKILDFENMNGKRVIKIQLDSGEQGYLLGAVFAD